MLEYMDHLTLRSDGRELRRRGNAQFPCSVYGVTLSNYVGHHVPWHWHDEIELKLMLEGTAVASCGEERFLLHTGDGLFINAHVLHHTCGLNGQDCTLGSIVFELPLLAGVAGSIFETRYLQPIYGNHTLPAVHLTSSVPWQSKALEHIRLAYEACEKETPGYELEIRARLSLFWKELFAANTSSLSSPCCAESETSARMRVMLSFLEDHFTEPIGPADLAEAAHISPRECFRCFDRIVGIPPLTYLLRRRISYAAELLRNTSLPVTEICFQVGFHSPSYFGKRFREQMGCTPQEFRAKDSSSL